jgi:glucose-6-phosphate isomerase
MVILPYKDRLELFAKYLQQLVMESVGKEKDLDDRVVNQGLSVYGNKGSTDQHAYIQQLRDGLNNFFCLFIEVLRDRCGESIQVNTDLTSGDYLFGYYLGTRRALADKGRESVSLCIAEVSPFVIGVLIALFERAVGFYSSLIDINAYHQPGVEAGKQAADQILAMKVAVVRAIHNSANPLNIAQIAAAVSSDDLEIIFKIAEHVAFNPEWGIVRTAGATPFDACYGKS